ncbi:ankyrin repeat-containing protein At2g01680-like isoform X2 [Chenopodium quinoa]|uniref:ankyrin repeat-containing protein At2g01680-like isoform X2 n=1 Tax=Chenopodium quinoa TaxID=63459 RepID=UPI000B785572|nr:ankyrin repeat-containing protein At2g01680-like isoform X2 [Chenopodium quinoa]
MSGETIYQEFSFDTYSHEGDRFVYPPLDPPSLPSEVPTSEDEFDVIGDDEFKHSSITIRLYQAALTGDWETVESIWREDNAWINTRITKGGDTVLHIAAAAKHLHLVKELVNVMNDDSLALTNRVGNTALCFAAVSGVVEIAKLMVDKSRTLPNIRGSQDMTPLLMAVLLGHQDMVWYLMSVTDYNLLTVEDGMELLTGAIDTDLFEVALHILRSNRNLATIRGRKEETALHALARKPPRLNRYQLSMWQKFRMQGCSTNHVEPAVVLELAQTLWDEIIKLKHGDISKLIGFPWRLLFVAAQLGKVEFLMVLIKSYPDILWKVDENRYSIFHIAVIYRHEEIFKLIHEIGAIKDLIATYKDDHGNNMLHLASKLAPPNRLNCVSGAALQMQRELLWFEAVKKIVRPEYTEAENKDHKTPQALFSEEHEGLRMTGEQWMKKTAESCAFVATLIATVVFSAAFQLPGGNNDNTGSPVLVKRPYFVVFAMANAVSLFTSTASILMFLSILTSQYAERDFLASLPLKLMWGLILLLISMATMIVAFTATFFMTFLQGFRWAPIPVALIASIPVLLFAFQQFPLLVDIYCSTYESHSIFQSCKPKLFKLSSQNKIPPHGQVDSKSRKIDIPFTILIPESSMDHILKYARNSFSWHRAASFIVDPEPSDTPSFSSWRVR